MSETEKIPEVEKYPVVEDVFDHCNRSLQGKIGPIKPGLQYPLYEHTDAIVGKNRADQITAWLIPPEKRFLLTHHNTVRDGSQGHPRFTVYADGKKVGDISESVRHLKCLCQKRNKTDMFLLSTPGPACKDHSQL